MADIHAIVVIPAKGVSTRLKRKNFQEIGGLTLIEHAIDYAKDAGYVDEIWVSTESDEVREIAGRNGVHVMDRPVYLLGEAEVADVYVDFIARHHNPAQFTHLVGLQPDHPDRDNELDTLLEYAVDNKYDDLFTVDSKGTRNGSVRIMKRDHVMQGKVSRRVGSYVDDCSNIHGVDDLERARKRIGND